ncbi:hypothetical protein, partial [Paenarthrobacter sp. Z7-10]|uniref:hypothetical protein n=1 Tax=Paenarthrobacter sp. Z7-10 TaxID=2787635 RepID=UPI0022A9EF21
ANKNHGTNDDQAVTMTTNAPPGTTGWGVFVPETSSKTLTPSSSNNATVNSYGGSAMTNSAVPGARLAGLFDQP